MERLLFPPIPIPNLTPNFVQRCSLGHSLRHISTPTPSSSSSQRTLTLDSLNSNPRKRKVPSILDEDSYVAAIEKIIEHNFFPDIPKLRDRLDWLQAVCSAGPLLIHDAQLKIIERRRRCHSSTTTTTRTPAFFVTPRPYQRHGEVHSVPDLCSEGPITAGSECATRGRK